MSERRPEPFGSPVCGIDGSPEALEAARQAAALAAPGARVHAVAAWDPGAAMHAGIHAGRVAAELRDEAVATLRAARDELPELETALVEGAPVAGLLAAASAYAADLVAVGSHGTSRRSGILLGSVATAIVHYAPCTVLVARAAPDFPGLVLHAGDGSPESAAAAAVAGAIAARHGSRLVALHVAGDDGGAQPPDLDSIRAAYGRDPVAEVESGRPHERIPERAGELRAGLVVVGSRGRTGLRSLGSVSERVAHRAPCSVLVVRSAAHPTVEPAPG